MIVLRWIPTVAIGLVALARMPAYLGGTIDAATQLPVAIGLVAVTAIVAKKLHQAPRGMVLGVVLLEMTLSAGLLASSITTISPTLTESPGVHLLGTDRLGRDVFARTLHGLRLSVAIGIGAAIVSTTLGLAVGALSALRGGWFDATVMRLVDAGLALPRLVLLIAIAALWNGYGPLGLVMLLGILSCFETSRIVNAEVRSLRSSDFMQAMRMEGATPVRQLWRGILPNVVPVALVATTLTVANAILLESGASFLGLGLDLQVASLGRMISDAGGLADLRANPVPALAPGAALSLLMVAISLLGDHLQVSLNKEGEAFAARDTRTVG